MTNKKTIMELQIIREEKQEEKKAKVKMTSIEQEIENDRESWLERLNIHIEKLFDKANKKKKILHHMAYQYLT